MKTPTDEIQKIKNIYLAGPFFNETEIKNVEYAENILADRGLNFFSPMREKFEGYEQGSLKWADAVFKKDVEEIMKADAVVALYYGSSGDTGTAWECGYAYAMGKPVVLVHVEKNGDSNIMMHCGVTTNIYLEDLAGYDFESMPVFKYSGKMF